eukprot:8241576-Ditylum_brightwellii.AAC.1
MDLSYNFLKDVAASAAFSHCCLNCFLDASMLAAIINNEYGLESHMKVDDDMVKRCFFYKSVFGYIEHCGKKLSIQQRIFKRTVKQGE